MKSSKHSISPELRQILPVELPEIYKTLHEKFGHQNWWPGDTPFEIMVGAILTQNTAWTNVEKAIQNLKKAGALSARAMHQMPEKKLAGLIRPSGYFNVKARRLKNFVDFFVSEYGGSISKMKREDGVVLRQKLLAVKGIGPETADCILLYAAGKTFFVVDAYTKRIFSRHKLHHEEKNRELFSRLSQMDYHAWQQIFSRNLPQNAPLFNDFHAQIVHLGKHFCRPSKPICQGCPLESV